MNIEFKVNPVGEIRKMRDTMYQDRFSWVEELIQNAMRSKATELYITINNDRVCFRDNGIGCDDPQIIFEKSSSGWDDETVEDQNPFGEGIFTVVMLGDNIFIRSRNWEVEFKPGLILENREIKGGILYREIEDYKDGFEVEVTDLQDEYYIFEISARVKEVAKYVESLDIYLDGQYIQKREFTEHDNSLFAMVIDNEKLTGWLRPYKWMHDGTDDDLKVYFQNRYVKNYHLNGIAGTIHINKPIVDLRSPDRREFIHNQKSLEFKNLLRNYAKKIMLDVVKNGGDEDIEVYEDTITYYLEMDEYAGHLKFLLQEGNYDLVDKLFEEYDPSSLKNSAPVEEIMGNEEITHNFETFNFEGKISSQSSESDKIYQDRINKTKRGVDWEKIQDYQDGFFVDLKHLHDYYDKIKLAIYYKIPIIIVKNKLERYVIEEKLMFKHIMFLSEDVEVAAKVEEVGIKDLKERRMMWLFNTISKAVGCENNIFRIGNLETSLKKKVGGIETEEPFSALAVAQGGMIYVDREKIEETSIKPSSSKSILKSDLKFIAKNIDVIAHELAHALYCTVDNTEEHYKKQLYLQELIFQKLI